MKTFRSRFGPGDVAYQRNAWERKPLIVVAVEFGPAGDAAPLYSVSNPDGETKQFYDIELVTEYQPDWLGLEPDE